MSVFAIILSLTLLMVGAYRGWSVVVLAPLLALLAVVLSGDIPALASYTQIFMTGLGSFVVSFFPIFLLGSIFGKLMERSGGARAIARAFLTIFGVRYAVPSLVLSCGLLTYGGVSAFVVVFTLYPLAASLFWELGLPKRFIPGTIALGALTFSMTALPGTAQIHNLIPMSTFGTTAFAAPGLGVSAAVMMLVLGLGWLQMRLSRALAAGEGYGHIPDSPEDIAPSRELPVIYALLPIVLIIGLNYVFSQHLIPSWDTAYLTEARFGSVSLSKVLGLWSMILALSIGVAVLAFIFWIRSRDLRCVEAVNAGALSSLLPTFNTASEVGYGATIAALAGFALIRDGIFALSPGNPLVAELVSINVLAGITGSASGGLSIALQSLGQQFLEMGRAAGIDPGVLHRVASLSSGGLDTFPHNGAVITLLTVCGLSHRESYKDIAVVSLVIPFMTTVFLVSMGSLLGVFS